MVGLLHARPNPIARALREHIRRRKITLSEIHARSGIDPANTSAFLNERRGLTADNLVKLMDAVGLLPAVLELIRRRP